MSEAQDVEIAYLMNPKNHPEPEPKPQSALRTLLVGEHFSPPAKALLKHLAQGTRCEFVPEPTNPYDPNAILVTIEKHTIVIDDLLADELASYGFVMDELSEIIKVGHIAASAGKPLEKAKRIFPDLVGNLQLMDSGALEGTFQFTAEGLNLIVVNGS